MRWSVHPDLWSGLAELRRRAFAEPTPFKDVDLTNFPDARDRLDRLQSVFWGDPAFMAIRREFDRMYRPVTAIVDLIAVDEVKTRDAFDRLRRIDGSVYLATSTHYRTQGFLLPPEEARVAGWTHYAMFHK